MSKIKELLKNTPLRPMYWKFRKIPPVKAVIRFRARKHRDHFLFKRIPDAYNAHRSEPIDPKKVLFIEPRGERLTDSMTGLYDLMQQKGMTVHCYLLNQLSVSPKEYEDRCEKYIIDMATAKYVFISDANDVISCVDKRPETIVTQTWHACGAFKKWGMSTAEKKFGYDREQQLRHPYYGNLNYVTVSSPEIIWAYAEAMNLQGQENIIRPTGISRTDVFFEKDFKEKAFDRLYKEFPQAKGKKVILFAPTFRGRVASAKTSEGPDLDLFYQHFQKDYVLVMKHHPFVKELPEIPEHLKGSFALDVTNTMTIEDLLCVSDICISDYSSLIFEYSLFERPMLFYAYDLDEYFDWRGFYYPYEELTPGPVCRTQEEMIDYIENIDSRFDRDRVRAFREKFMSSCDGKATERIIDMVLQET